MRFSHSVLVSAVIPTRNRPGLVLRAVRSALGQTLDNLEVIVVIDGPDSITADALHQFQDQRLRVLALPQSVGACEARNVGVREADGEWVAFLDDDDEWLPTKLEKQIRVARQSSCRYPIVSCRFLARTPKGQYEWPRRIPRPDEPISEYLFARRSFFQGEACLGTPTLLARRVLLLETPFENGLRRHQDTDWVLRAVARGDARVEFVPEPLAICYLEEPRRSIGNTDDWRYSLNWARHMRPLMTKRAYSGYVLTCLSSAAAYAKDWGALYPLLREAITLGRPTLRQLQLFVGMWIVPRNARRSLRAAIFRTVRSKHLTEC
jgi:glycosyltransferase involved in cell wall biosynthesis